MQDPAEMQDSAACRDSSCRLQGRIPSSMSSHQPAAKPGYAALMQAAGERLLRAGHSRRATDAQLHWIERFMKFHGDRHPDQLGEGELVQFLDHLCSDRTITIAAHNQALTAMMFIFTQVLGRNPAAFTRFRPQRPTYAVPLLAEMGPGWRGHRAVSNAYINMGIQT